MFKSFGGPDFYDMTFQSEKRNHNDDLNVDVTMITELLYLVTPGSLRRVTRLICFPCSWQVMWTGQWGHV